MALIPTIKVCSKSGCTKVTVTDTKGAYDVTTNVKGWGSPNIDPTDSGFAVSLTIDGGTAINMLDEQGFPTSNVVTTAEVLPITTTNAGSYSTVVLYSNYPVNDTVISGNLQLQSGDSYNDTVYKLNNAFNAVSSGFVAYNSGSSVRIQPPVGTGATYNGRTIRIASSSGTIWFTFSTTGVNEVTALVNGPITGNIVYNDIPVDLTDGWHTITYTVGTTAVAATSITKKIFVYCAIKCCVETKMESMKDFDPCKDAGELLKYFHMYNLYKTMIFEANGCNSTEASATLLRLQKLCNINADCGCS